MWLIGMANRKRTICSACEPCYVIRSEHKFFAVFDSLVVLTDCSDVEMSISGDVCADRQNQLLYPCGCMWGNKIISPVAIYFIVVIR